MNNRSIMARRRVGPSCKIRIRRKGKWTIEKPKGYKRDYRGRVTRHYPLLAFGTPNEGITPYILKVRDGKVRINKKVYCAWNPYIKYDGRMDGNTYIFLRYDDYLYGNEDIISFWGTPEYWLNQAYPISKRDTEILERLQRTTLVPPKVNGLFPWTIWRASL